MDVSLFASTRAADTRLADTHPNSLQMQADEVPLTEDVLRRLRESGL